MDRRVRLANHGFSLDDPLGHGSFAEVFKGWSREGAAVAVKRIAKSKLGKSNNRRLLEQEVSILEKLRHPNIVQLQAHEELGDFIYLVMEYCNGGDLAAYLQTRGSIAEDEIQRFLAQLVDALNYLETNNIVHRDLKPQNILLHVEGEEVVLKIADFGFARTLFEEDMAATFCGSPLYMAPEVLEGEAYNASADLWSLGAIIFQCLTGSPPFRAPSIKALKLQLQQVTRPPIPDTASSALADLLSGLLQVDPRARMTLPQLTRHPFLVGSSVRQPLSASAAAEGAPDDLDDALQTPAAEVTAAAKDLEERSYVLVDPLYVDVNTLADSMERRMRLGPTAGGRDPHELVAMLLRVTNSAGLVISIANGALTSGGESAAGRAQARGEALVLFAKALALLRKGIGNLRVLLGRTTLSLTRELVGAVQQLRRQFNDSMTRIEEIRAEMTSTQMQSVRTSVSQLLYRHAVLLCRDAAHTEKRGAVEESARLYSKALLLLEVVLPDAHERDIPTIQSLLLSLEDRLRHARAIVEPRRAGRAASTTTTATAATGAGSPFAAAAMGSSPGAGGSAVLPALAALASAAGMASSPPQAPASRSNSRPLTHGTPPDDAAARASPRPLHDSTRSRLPRTPSAKQSLSTMEAAAALLATSPPSLPSASLVGSPPTIVGPGRSPSTRSFKASFCGSCGTQYSSEDQRFCMRCGVNRVGSLPGDTSA